MSLHMHVFSEATIQSLQSLIEGNLDSAEGFRTAADIVTEPRLSALFSDIADIRGQFARQLQQMVAVDEKPAESGTLMGAAQRWWLKLRGTISPDNAYGVLAEAERSEDRIKDLYEDAMRTCDEPDVLTLLQEQFVQVKADHDRVRDLRDSYQQAS